MSKVSDTMVIPLYGRKLAKVLAKVADNGIKMQIVKVAFGGELPKPKVDKKAASSKATEEKKLYIPVLGKYFNQTRKPEGVLGKMMLAGMNSGHAKLADWGMQYLVFTTKHHEGFAMYDSKVSDYNVVKATPYGKGQSATKAQRSPRWTTRKSPSRQRRNTTLRLSRPAP